MKIDLRMAIEQAFGSDPRFGGIIHFETDDRNFGNQLAVFLYGELTLRAVCDRGDLIAYVKTRDSFTMIDTIDASEYKSAADLHQLLFHNAPRFAQAAASAIGFRPPNDESEISMPIPSAKRKAPLAKRIKTYSAFFDFYLGEHSLPLTRALHYVGSSCGLAALALTIWSGNPLWILAGLLAGYGCAWIGHFFVEHNRPATFTYPLWSFIGDYHMFFLWLTGQLGKRRQSANAHKMSDS